MLCLANNLDHGEVSLGKIALGVTDVEVPRGRHLIHFWHTGSEFERGVRFLALGIAKELQGSRLSRGVHKDDNNAETRAFTVV